MIKAIETRYNGYRFRSRLEARWAIFFDIQGIKYEYELEGFDLGAAGYYLPDFYLPVVKMWGEVKPIELTEEERRKAEALATMTLRPCLMLIGAPDLKEYDSIEYCTSWDNDHLEQAGEIISYPYTLAVTKWYKNENRFPVMYCQEPQQFIYMLEGNRYIDAVHRARSARFEHGETPSV